MSTEEAIRRCFSLWRDYNSRAKRKEFWHYFSFCLVGLLCIGWLANEAVFIVGFGSNFAQGIIYSMQIAMLIIYLPFIAVLSRRLVDVGLPIGIAVGSATMVLLVTVLFVLFRDPIIDAGFPYIAPIANSIALLMALLPSKARPTAQNEVPQ
ncbi:MAG: DUF805 domain-containing protein [Pseudomonadota bacterium]